MSAYYNEWDPYAAQWLRNLIAGGHLPDGEVDERSICDVAPEDTRGFTQCHFFAGIGGWPLALRLAGWPDDEPVWTGSCPCQPFSTAGKRLGTADPRHLWPEWFRLIRERRPARIFGEQVARAASAGWYDLVADDLEGEGYALGAAVLPAFSVGAPHRRDRLFFVAHASSSELRQQPGRSSRAHGAGAAFIGKYGQGQSLADAERAGLEVWQQQSTRQERKTIERSCEALPHAHGQGECGLPVDAKMGGAPSPARTNGWWSIEPDMGRVAHGVPARVGRLRAYGNAIVPQVAAEFIAAYMSCRP